MTAMLRIRRKFALIISGLVVVVFLFLYLLINYSIPTEKPNWTYIESKLKQLENGLNMHQAEVGKMQQQIDTIHMQNNYAPVPQQSSERLELNRKEMLKDDVIKADKPFRSEDMQECSLRTDIVPKVDIQMLDVYRKIPFDNPDGGVWKQGWPIKYDPHQWNRHHKLKVFVVPHSHNDPGWIKTFDEYYEQTTKVILSNMLRHLEDHEEMKFIWAEISYLSRWYDKLQPEPKKRVKRLIDQKRLEIVTGGWVMPDEANSHWLSVLIQLTEGHTWLKTNLNMTPTSGWAIDPFGESPSLQYLLKGSNIKYSLIQRTHYSVKKYLAQQRQLEFRWRQIWDTTGTTDMFTHMMPFYSYDVPHTCGPDPKVCCQFDFKRLPGYGVQCPWKIAPQPIVENNVAKKADLIVDQWRKKSMLYKTRSVLIPLGDDFRYGQSTEWEAQRSNFNALFEYINNEPSLHVEAKFATLSDYFESVTDEMKETDFPVLSGDFFTYADRDDHYWSGYFTSRPYYKRMDRILLNYVRSADMLHAWTRWESEANLSEQLVMARRELSLFQHHDGVAGTAKDEVMLDYAERMTNALKACKFVIQQSAYKLLTKPSIYRPDYKFTYFDVDDSRVAGEENDRPTIILGDELPSKYVVLHNSLAMVREELVEFIVSKPFIMITDANKVTVPCQVAPIWSWHKNLEGTMAPQQTTTKYRVMFRASVPPMGLAVYIIQSTSTVENSLGTTFAKITIHTDSPFSAPLGDYPYPVKFVLPQETAIRIGEGPGASFSSSGLLKSISVDSQSKSVPVHLAFLKYGARTQTAERSGAYLFLPDGPAMALPLGQAIVVESQGELESSITAGLVFGVHESVLRGSALEIKNTVDIREMNNAEIVMRLSSGIKSGETFYTDLNGLQLIKRERFNKLPLQANYYPVPTSISIEDESLRLTVLTGTSLGGSSLQSGEIEIMQDRRLNQDDNRGLGQGVLDNRPTVHFFKVLIENRESCIKLNAQYSGAFPTSYAHNEQQTLLHPMEKLVYAENDWIGVLPNFGLNHQTLERGVDVALLRELPHIKTKDVKQHTVGVVLHRTNLAQCSNDENHSGLVNLSKLLDIGTIPMIFSAPLTMIQKGIAIDTEEISICPMEMKAFIITR